MLEYSVTENRLDVRVTKIAPFNFFTLLVSRYFIVLLCGTHLQPTARRLHANFEASGSAEGR